MKYYSEKTDKFYDTEEACIAAEQELKDRDEKRKEDYDKVQNFRKAYLDAYDKYKKALNDYSDMYGSLTFKTEKSPFDLFREFYKN